MTIQRVIYLVKVSNSKTGVSDLIEVNYLNEVSEVVTQRGARVPLREARIMLKKIIRGEAKTGDQVGNFSLRHLDTTKVPPVVVVGCHKFDLEQCKAVLLTSDLKLVD